jgi:NAD(P)H dehydrogenase (quinone)
MHVYIVFAHPSIGTFCSAVLEVFTAGLQDAGHTYEVGDLYRMDFTSEMDLKEYQREVSLKPDVPVTDDVKAEQAKIDGADALVFIYPVWWSDCPAKLKGWFDRVFTYGYAYFYDDAEERHTRIEIEKALVICPAGHTVEDLEGTGIAEGMRRIMLSDRLLGVGIKEARMEILGGMMPPDDRRRDTNLKKAYELGRSF